MTKEKRPTGQQPLMGARLEFLIDLDHEFVRLAQELDPEVMAFRERLLEGPCRYLWLDAMYPKVREGQRVAGLAVLVAIVVNQQGYREVLGLEVADGEMETAWSGLLEGLIKRGLKGVELVVSDAHTGLKAAVRRVLAFPDLNGVARSPDWNF